MKRYARLAVLGAAVVAVAVVLSLLLPRWLDLRGSPVSSWNDELSLTTIEFPAGWQHMRLDRGDLPYLFPPTEHNLQSIRGSFAYPRGEVLNLVLCWRMVSLGATAGPTRSYTSEERAAEAHRAIAAHLEQLGASYTPLGAADNPTARISGDMVPMTEGIWLNDRTPRMFRIDGKIEHYPARFAGFTSRPLHLVQLQFMWSNRSYTVDVLMPASQYAQVWPEAMSLINSAELRKVSL